jgi:hypothetical protein
VNSRDEHRKLAPLAFLAEMGLSFTIQVGPHRHSHHRVSCAHSVQEGERMPSIRLERDYSTRADLAAEANLRK